MLKIGHPKSPNERGFSVPGSSALTMIGFGISIFAIASPNPEVSLRVLCLAAGTALVVGAVINGDIGIPRSKMWIRYSAALAMIVLLIDQALILLSQHVQH